MSVRFLEEDFSFQDLIRPINNTTLAHELINRDNYFTKSAQIASIKDNNGISVARAMISKYAEAGYFINDYEILSIVDEAGVDSMASLQYKKSKGFWLPEDFYILSILNKKLEPLAHTIAFLHKKFTGFYWLPFHNEQVLFIKDKLNYTPMLHVLASAGWTTQNVQYLQATDRYNNTTAHVIASQYKQHQWEPQDFDVYFWVNSRGDTVAHILSLNGWRTENRELLTLVNNEGVSVAFIQASQGWKPDNFIKDKELLSLKDPKTGLTVASCAIWHGWEPKDLQPDKHILKHIRLSKENEERYNKILALERSLRW